MSVSLSFTELYITFIQFAISDIVRQLSDIIY